MFSSGGMVRTVGLSISLAFYVFIFSFDSTLHSIMKLAVDTIIDFTDRCIVYNRYLAPASGFQLDGGG